MARPILYFAAFDFAQFQTRRDLLGVARCSLLSHAVESVPPYAPLGSVCRNPKPDRCPCSAQRPVSKVLDSSPSTIGQDHTPCSSCNATPPSRVCSRNSSQEGRELLFSVIRPRHHISRNRFTFRHRSIGWLRSKGCDSTPTSQLMTLHLMTLGRVCVLALMSACRGPERRRWAMGGSYFCSC